MIKLSPRAVFYAGAHPEERSDEGSMEIPRHFVPRDEGSGSFSPTPQKIDYSSNCGTLNSCHVAHGVNLYNLYNFCNLNNPSKMFIGQKVKELRKARKMTLSALAQKSGVQLATLSRIENLKMTGTLESHMKIAKALDIALPQLYQEIIKEEKKVEVQTPRSATDVFVHSEKSSYEIMTPKVLAKKMMPMLLKIAPGGATNAEQNTIGSEKFIFVLEGKIRVEIGEETHSLSKHNTLYFDSSLKHRFVNPGKSLARAVCVVTPVAL